MQAYFEGLYFKQQNEKESVALIPAVHVDGRGRRSASLQIVTDEGAHQIWYEGMEAVISRAQNSRGACAGCRRRRRTRVWQGVL